MNFELILSNKVFCRMFGLVVIEVMTPSGHLSNINEMGDFFKFCGLLTSKQNSNICTNSDWFKREKFRIDHVKPLREDHTRL